jgi:hypothetical protein
MNIRMQKYKANRLKGMNQYNAARAAGYSESMARVACRIEKSVKVSITDALERAGITPEYRAAELVKLTQANKVISCNVIASDGEGMKDANSMTKDFIDVPDNAVRLNAHKHIAELMGDVKSKVEHEVSGKVTFVEMKEIELNGKPLRYKIGQTQDSGLVGNPGQDISRN